MLKVFFSLAVVAAMTGGCATQASREERGSPDLRASSIRTVTELAKAGKVSGVSDPERVMETARESVRVQLKDPTSAQFKNMRIVNYKGGQLVCGEVNGKNSYGGYTGFTPFVSAAGLALLWKKNKYPSLERDFNAGTTDACSVRG